MGRTEQEREMKRKMKELETPEQKRQRRLEKQEKKDSKKSGKSVAEDMMGYTNDANPFGDSNLTEKFSWKLKREKLKDMGLNPDKVEAEREKRKRDEIKIEIEKVKKRRQERELEKQQWEEERARLAREKDSAEYQDWEKKEDEFHLNQAKQRSELRIKQGRAKPIDILFKTLSRDPNFDPTHHEPFKIFKGLTLEQLVELENDIKLFLELDSHKTFWQALMTVCDDELLTARKRAEFEKKHGRVDNARFEDHSGVHSSVTDDVSNIFKGKTNTQLADLQASIVHKIESGGAVDVEYWEGLLKRLTVFKAKAVLREIHDELVRSRNASIEGKQAQDFLKTGNVAEPRGKAKVTVVEPVAAPKVVAPKPRVEDDSEYHAGGLSPELIHSIEDGEEIVDAECDWDNLLEMRKEVMDIQTKKMRMSRITEPSKQGDAGRLQTDDEMKNNEADKLMEEGEEQFNVDVPLENKVYQWHDKYRPRKPKFFNRVHTGYEWNKYNQTHYDMDNPPPKIVQGYKFNIFYPDLIEKHKAPTYHIEPTKDPETCILRFHAGAPYEDIAFKVVVREWEYSHKKGFKCTFERGILHLWFNFKRYRYRR